ncbi:MAG: putative iron-sulfur protein, partial [Pseudomonadota bacterium]
LIIISTVLVNNIVLVKILGLCPFMGVSKKLETSVSMSAATAFVLTIGSMTSWAINHYLLEPNDLVYLRTLSFILVIAGVVQFTEMLMEKNFPLLYQLLGIFLPLITTNCAVLGIPLLNAQSSHTLIESALFGFGGAIGFSIVLILFASIRERLEGAEIPLPFKGTAIALVTASIMSLCNSLHYESCIYGIRGLGSLMVTALLVMIFLAILLGLVLGYSAIRFKVDGDPMVARIDAILPQTQCGQCGFPGCKPYANAIAKGEADINQCPPGGDAGAKALAELMGVEFKPLNQEHGIQKPKSVALIDEATCIGCTLCIQACPVDAILGAAKQMHTIIASECTGCELCLPPCPVDCITMEPVHENSASWKWKYPIYNIQKTQKA